MLDIAKSCKKYNSIFLERGNTGILLIHGITKTPRELQELAEKLANKGFTVYCPLLPNHGTCPSKYETCWRDVLDLNPSELKERVEKAFREMRGSVDKIYVGGISLGANLAFHLAVKYKVDGIISIGAAISLNKGLEFLTALGPRVGNLLDTKDKRGLNNDFVYHDFPISNLFHMLSFQKEIKGILPDVNAPVLIIQSVADNLVDSKSATYISKKIKSKKKRLIWVENKGHGITDADVCFKEICKFIRDNNK